MTSKIINGASITSGLKYDFAIKKKKKIQQII